jgi:hypothetical protein
MMISWLVLSKDNKFTRFPWQEVAPEIDPATLSDAEIEARIARLQRTAVVARAAKSAGTVH